MRKKLIRYKFRIFLMIIIGILLLQIAFFTPNGMIKDNVIEDKRKIKESNFWVLTTKIHIDNNWTATNSTFDWCTGSGTPADPYIIENVTIDAQNEGSCIYIKNTVEYFIIQNCTLTNSQASPNAAIRLDYVSNGKILDNNITNNAGRSVSLYGGNNNLVEDNTMANNGYGVTLSYSNNNRILKNYIQDTDLYGIYLWDSDNNYISENEIKHCGYYAGGYHGIYISESGTPSFVDSINNTIIYNHVDNSRKSGIYINSCDNNTIFGNNIENNLDYGVHLDDSDDVNIIGNKIHGNSDGCVSVQSSLNTKEEWNVCNYELDPFIIDELGGGDFTWNRVSQFAWCSGKGSYSDPYIIENVTIDAQNEGSCIYIKNTVEYFIIQNCTLTNSQASPNAAIRLDYVSNGKILDNSITNNAGRSVSLYGGSNNLVEDNTMVNNGYGVTLTYGGNNKVFNNYIEDADLYGIQLWNSDNNIIYENEVNHCGYYGGTWHGIYISESGNPSTNNTIRGNYVHGNKGSGIYVDSSDNNTILGNTIESNLDYGVYLDDSDDVNIIGNKIQFNSDGCISTGTSLNTKEEWNVCNHILDPFIIDELGGGNFTWDQVSQFAWCTGDGSYSNPYSIASVVIDAQSVGSCIRIENSYDNYFSIEGCLIMNAQATGGEAGIFLDEVHNGTIYNCEISYNYAGIILSNSKNITIEGNSIDSNPGQGIILDHSEWNLIIDNEQEGSKYYGLFLQADSNNNSISGNRFQYNTGAATHGDGIRIKNSESNNVTDNILTYNDRGIKIEDASYYNKIVNNTILYNANYGALVIADPSNSINNLFYLNRFNNTVYNAFDNGTNTQWDNGLIGNYWSDYGGIDANDDGIGDTPYLISGTGTTVDEFPIWDDGDSISPIITILSPLNNSKYNITAPNYSISIVEENLDTYYYVITGTSGNFTQIIQNLSGSINQTLWDLLPEGTYILKFFVNDTAGNSASASIIINKESITETAPPEIPFGSFYLIIAILSIVSLFISIEIKVKKSS